MNNIFLATYNFITVYDIVSSATRKYLCVMIKYKLKTSFLFMRAYEY